MFSSHLVQERRDEAERLSGLSVNIVVEESDNTSNDRRRGGCSTNRLNLTFREDEDVGSQGSNVRESSSVRVVVRGRRELDARLEVGSNGTALMGRDRSNLGETTTRGEVSLSKAYALLSSGRSTVKSRASRRRVGEVGASRSRGDLGGTNGGDVRRSSREDRVKVALRARWVSTSIGARVSRSADEGNSTKTNLLEFSVDALNVLGVVKSHRLALSTTDTVLALVFLIPTIGDGVYKRNILGSEHVAGESVQPDVVLLNPEPSLSANGDTKNVLDIKGSLNLRVGRVIVSNDVVVGKRRDVDGELSSELGQVGGGEVLVLEFDDTSRGVSSNLSRANLVDSVNRLGSNGNQSLRLLRSRLLEVKARSRELAETSNELNVVSKEVRDREGSKLADELLT